MPQPYFQPFIGTWWFQISSGENKKNNILKHFSWLLTPYCSIKVWPCNQQTFIPSKFCPKNINWWWSSSHWCIPASVYCWTSVCLAEEKPLHRKCFPQLLGVSFPTLRPTKRQIAAKSCDSSAAEMPFSLLPDLSKHSRHICLPQWAGPFHLIKVIDL